VCESDGRVQRATLRQLPTPLSLLREWLKPSGSTARSADSVEPVAALNGAFLWIARTRFDALGGLDAGYFLHFEDLDLIARVRASGAPIVRFNPVEVRHAKGASDAPTVAVEAAKAASMRRYFARHTPHAFGARWVPWLARLRVRVCAARWARADARR
jgi:N-acetylglucosaminyl-diphospho-decaprenol L-rhamnosyltransferase